MGSEAFELGDKVWLVLGRDVGGGVVGSRGWGPELKLGLLQLLTDFGIVACGELDRLIDVFGPTLDVCVVEVGQDTVARVEGLEGTLESIQRRLAAFGVAIRGEGVPLIDALVG